MHSPPKLLAELHGVKARRARVITGRVAVNQVLLTVEAERRMTRVQVILVTFITAMTLSGHMLAASNSN